MGLYDSARADEFGCVVATCRDGLLRERQRIRWHILETLERQSLQRCRGGIFERAAWRSDRSDLDRGAVESREIIFQSRSGIVLGDLSSVDSSDAHVFLAQGVRGDAGKDSVSQGDFINHK